MLFPLAQTNLADYFANHPAQSLSKKYALGILDQLINLADGVNHIHRLRGSPTSGSDSPGATGEGDFGYHHDLKPANVLIFSKNQEDAWKIADFGNARIYRALRGRSQRTPNLTMGEETYASPDWQIQQETSRPYDIWSLGCIYLEVLVWLFWSRPGEGLSEFETRRKRDKEYQGYPAFWYLNNEKDVSLRPSVVEVQTALEERTERGFYRQVVTITNRMLTLNPKDRPPASWVKSGLEGAKMQAIIDLADLAPDDQYINDQSIMQLPRTQQVTAPVSLPYAESDSIDRGSVMSIRESTTRPGSSQSNAEAAMKPEIEPEDEQFMGVGQQHTQNPVITFSEPLDSPSPSPRSRRPSRGQSDFLSPRSSRS